MRKRNRQRRRRGSKTRETFCFSERERRRKTGFFCLFFCLAGCKIGFKKKNTPTTTTKALNAFDNSVTFRSSVCFVCWLSKRVCACAEEVGEGSLCNLKGKYKAHKAGSAGRQQERQGKEKVVGIC